MNKNEIYVVKECIFDNPLITDIDSKIDSCFEDCHNKYFHKFKYESIYDIKLTNMTDYEIVNWTISSKSRHLYELKKLEVARHNDFIINQINRLTIKINSHLRFSNISYYLKFQIPMCHRQFFRVISQNREFINIFCNDVANLFHCGCRKWYLDNQTI